MRKAHDTYMYVDEIIGGDITNNPRLWTYLKSKRQAITGVATSKDANRLLHNTLRPCLTVPHWYWYNTRWRVIRFHRTHLQEEREKHTLTNYRPVSLTSFCWKCLENIVHDNIMDHYDHLKILTNNTVLNPRDLGKHNSSSSFIS